MKKNIMQAKWWWQPNCEVFDLTKNKSSLKLETVIVSAGIVSQTKSAWSKNTKYRKFGLEIGVYTQFLSVYSLFSVDVTMF